MILISNTFTINMLSPDVSYARIYMRMLEPDQAKLIAQLASFNVITVPEIDQLLRHELDVDIPKPVKVHVSLNERDEVLVARYIGPRIECAGDPPPFTMQYWLVSFTERARSKLLDALSQASSTRDLIARARKLEARAIEVLDAYSFLQLSSILNAE